MPTMSEATSRFSVSEDLLRHTSPQEKLLKWIQDHPGDCRRTSIVALSNRILIPNSGLTPKQIKSCLYGMTNSQMLLQKIHGKGNTAPRTVYINYMHKNLPKSILDSAPEEQLEDARRIVEGAAIKREARRLLLEEQEQAEKVIQASQPVETKPVESTPTVEIPLKKEDLSNGFSLTLNINFNIGK